MTWLACELHTHTYHSDGRQTLEELAQGAKALGFDCIALTDHNTMTGLQDKEKVEQAAGIKIISGMEWTTFFGHMVTIGVKDYVDWRPVGPADLHGGLARVHEQGGIAGLAHPFRMGSPLCTGCFWEFEVSDWNQIDYIEVWSTTFAPLKNNNARAFRLWTDKLNEGCRIAAVSGRDWHSQEPADEPLSVTYLRLQEGDFPITDKAVAALSAGRASVTLGPRLDLLVELAGNVYGIGDVVPAAEADRGFSYRAQLPERDAAPYDGGWPHGPGMTVRIFADFHVRKGMWELPDQSFTLRLQSNLGMLAEKQTDARLPGCEFTLPADGLRWMRAELWGVIRGVRTILAFTNAVYFE